jgi:hypothetical protein
MNRVSLSIGLETSYLSTPSFWSHQNNDIGLYRRSLRLHDIHHHAPQTSDVTVLL